jgi:hypothetical protein
MLGTPPRVALLTGAHPVRFILWVYAGGNWNYMVKLDSTGTLAPMAWPIPLGEEAQASRAVVP